MRVRERVSTSGQRVPVVSNPRFLATAGSFANCLDFPRILSLILYYIVQFHWICPSIRDVDSHHSVSHGSRANRVQRPPPAPPRCGHVIPWLTKGCAQSHPIPGLLTPPEKTRTDHSGRGGSPSHISKMVPSTVHSGPRT